MNMTPEPEQTRRGNDGVFSWILVVIWLGGLILVRNLREDIPLTMLVIGTVFFIVLIPAMKEITRNLDRLFTRQSSDKAN
jgi:hypothetical protein